ncbi:zinc transporter ZntB [Terasakiella pusilla]|uniref:zinc transporter ZntB n=1 Tax=Terasakiella pusilla TaxID=64973 RepID=UPI0004915289|nr:zinc transporter ZntB [Terasakiella pusilla]
MSALVTAWQLNASGGGEELREDQIASKLKEDKIVWVHLDAMDPEAKPLLKEFCELDVHVEASLFASNTRPRADEFEDGCLINLRGVNVNEGKDPVDMISARLWISGNMIISLRRQRMMAFNDLREQLARGKGPTGQGDFVARVSNLLTVRMLPVLEAIDDQITSFEDMDYLKRGVDDELIEQRQNAARLNRYITPQQQALLKLSTLEADWLSDGHKTSIRQALDSVMLYLDEIKELKERMEILNDQLQKQSNGRIEHTMYVLSVVAGIFLPLGFLTGLLGINVGGMPGVEDQNAFWLVSLIILVIGIAEFMYFKWKKWI